MSDTRSDTAGRYLTSSEQEIMHEALRRSLRFLCDECGKSPTDHPSKLYPGCEACQEHQR